MCVMKCLKRFGGGEGRARRNRDSEPVFGVFLLLCGEAADSALNHFCAKPSPSSVSGCVAGRGARASPLAIMLDSRVGRWSRRGWACG